MQLNCPVLPAYKATTPGKLKILTKIHCPDNALNIAINGRVSVVATMLCVNPVANSVIIISLIVA